MTDARLRVVAAGPLVTYQDAGRPGHMRYGVPRSGPMDRLAFAMANAAIGNPVDAAAIEVSVGGLTVECDDVPITVAVAGGEFTVRHGERVRSAWTVVTLAPGEQLSIRSGPTGSWAYLALAGSVEAATWLGRIATHSPSGLGGGALATGDDIAVAAARATPDLDGSITVPAIARPLRELRVVMGPQDRHLTEPALAAFRSSPYRFTTAVDRMGARLDGPALELAGALSIPSEPIVRGSIQVSGDGVATLLTADHQTTGGYPKVATVISADLDRAAQLRSPDEIRFVEISPDEAVAAARVHARAFAEALSDAATRRTLAQRLVEHNLIGDASPDVALD